MLAEHEAHCNVLHPLAECICDCNYGKVTPLEWAEYEFATIEYDYKIHPDAAKAIRSIFERLDRNRI